MSAIVEHQVARDVTEFLYRYAEAVDARDVLAIRTLLADDVLLSRNGETTEGADAFMAAYQPFIDSDAVGSRHAINNAVVEILRGNVVRVRAVFEATVFRPLSTTRMYGRYEDDLRFIDGSWQFVHKRNFMQWSVELPAPIALGVSAARPGEA